MNLWRKLLPMLTNNFIKVSWNRGTTWVVVEVVPSG